MRIGIFGGTFNPPHNGHIQLARTFLREAKLDEVWLMVSPQNPFKVGDALPADDYRLRLVQAAVAGEPSMRACDFEFHLEKPSFTWRTLKALRMTYPEHEFALLVGGDNWAAFDRWAHPEEILAHHQLYVYPRLGNTPDQATLPQGVHALHGQLLDVSSTEIRRRLQTGASVADLVPECVAALL